MRGLISPMLATLVPEPVDRPGWSYEEKYDGDRAMAYRRRRRVRLYSRNLKDITAEFDEIARAVAGLPGGDLILDGEIVIFDRHGVSRFQLLQRRAMGEPLRPVFAIFDCLARDGVSLLRRPLAGRRRALEAVVPMNCRTGSLDRPDWLAFDLDPGSGAFADAARAGHLLHEILHDRGIRSYPKTSGGRGLHVLVPLRRNVTQDTVRAFAQQIGSVMAERSPRLVTVAMAKTKRRRRVFVDTLRNAFGQTIVAPYSVRRRPRAPVSSPLDWDEVDVRLDPARYTLRTIERRLADADPWADFWTRRQSLPAIS